MSHLLPKTKRKKTCPGFSVMPGLLVLLLCSIVSIPATAQTFSQQMEHKADSLVNLMTLTEKISQLGNSANAIARLNIPAYNYWSEGLHGVARSGLATSFPQAIALSSTWDPELLYEISSVTSTEARVMHKLSGKGLTYWSPTINMARDPRWGRAEENYGEDTYLASRLAVNFIKGMQGNQSEYLKTVATAKHFACNNIEVNRYGRSSDVDARSLREYYLPVFKTCVQEAGVYSVMSAYNALNGVPCPANRNLLTHILRDEWGFNGFVVSDCDAVSNVFDAHHYVTNASQASAFSITNGTDLNCGTTYPGSVNAAINAGILTVAEVDTALKRMFKARFMLGEFDESNVPYNNVQQSDIDTPTSRELALKAAREAIVLLKNENNFLPLNKELLKTIAVIGPNANVVQLGGYSGSPSVMVSPYRGILAKLGIEYNPARIEAESFSSQYNTQTEGCSEGGSNVGFIQNGSYLVFDSVNFGAYRDTILVRVASAGSGGNIELHLDSLTSPVVQTIAVAVTGGWQSWKTVTSAIPSTSGKHNLYLKFTGSSGYLFNLNWFELTGAEDTSTNTGPNVLLAQGCSIKGNAVQADIDTAVAIARRSDVVLLFCGTDLTVADEGADRTTLDLPGAQEQLIESVYAANPNTALVLVTGFSLAVNWAQQNLPAILCAWYDGQAQGTAIADVLFGDYNPGGKLSTTWYKSTSDLPDMNDYNIRHGRTYQYFTGTPLYPFGYGLSYTSFNIDNLQVSKTNLGAGDSVEISADVTNTGNVKGDEVVQLYVKVNASVTMPNKQLKGFKRVTLEASEKQTVAFVVKNSDLAYYDSVNRAFVTEACTVDLMVGNSSANISLTGQLNVAADTVERTWRVNARSLFEAENLDGKSKAPLLVKCTEGGKAVSMTNGSYLLFQNIDFSAGTDGFYTSISLDSGSGTLHIMLDKPTGTEVGALELNGLGADVYSYLNTTLTSITGIHDIYLVYNGTKTAYVNWFTFDKNIVSIHEKTLNQIPVEWKVYPNPTAASFTIECNLKTRTPVSLAFYSLQGKLLKQVDIPEQSVGLFQKQIDPREMDEISGQIFVVLTVDGLRQIKMLNIQK